MPRPPAPPGPNGPPADKLVGTNLRELLDRLLPIMPVLKGPFYMIGTHRLCQETFRIEWCMPMASKLVVIDDPQRLCSIDGRGQVLWQAPDYWRVRHPHEILYMAEHARGFEIQPTSEYIEWLKKHMRNLAQAQASAGLLALDQLVRKRR